MALHVEVGAARPLRFDDGTPVRAASAIAAFAGGWLVVQDDATHAAWWTGDGIRPVRVFPPVAGHDVFSEAAGTKGLKPDLEAACGVLVADHPAVLLLGSGSSPARTRAALVALDGTAARVATAELAPLYVAVGRALGVAPDQLNLEGACRQGRHLRWFNRGNRHAGVPNGSVDVDVDALVAAVTGRQRPEDVPLGDVLHYDLGAVAGVGLAVTDAVDLGGGRALVSAAAEDTPNAVDDGPVVASALALLHDGTVEAVTPLADPAGGPPHKVEGLALRRADRDGVELLAVVDADDPDTPSVALELAVRWG